MPSGPSGRYSFTGISGVRATPAMIRMKGDHQARTPSCFAVADRQVTRKQLSDIGNLSLRTLRWHTRAGLPGAHSRADVGRDHDHDARWARRWSQVTRPCQPSYWWPNLAYCKFIDQDKEAEG